MSLYTQLIKKPFFALLRLIDQYDPAHENLYFAFQIFVATFLCGIYVLYFLRPDADIILFTPLAFIVPARFVPFLKDKYSIMFWAYVTVCVFSFSISVFYNWPIFLGAWLSLITFITLCFAIYGYPYRLMATMCILLTVPNLAYDQTVQMGYNHLFSYTVCFFICLFTQWILSDNIQHQFHTIILSYLKQEKLLFNLSFIRQKHRGKLIVEHEHETFLRNTLRKLINMRGLEKQVSKTKTAPYCDMMLSMPSRILLRKIRRSCVYLAKGAIDPDRVFAWSPLCQEIIADVNHDFKTLIDQIRYDDYASGNEKKILYQQWREEYENNIKKRQQEDINVAKYLYGLDCLKKDIVNLQNHLYQMAKDIKS